ncbi:MAG: prolyl oligopeptidase family serine peptidase [Pseudomonadota bacterium]
MISEPFLPYFKTLGAVLVISTAASGCQPVSEQTTAPLPPASNVLSYPDSRTEAVYDEYFGERVRDPYRWLEDDRSEETGAWVKAQNALTQDYLGQIPYRASIANRVERLLNYERVSAPFVEGDYTYFYRNNGLQNQDVLYRQRGGETAEVFIDPNSFSEDGTTSMAGLRFSRDGSMLAYELSEGGSDWRSIHILDAATGSPIGQALEDVKFSSIAWVGKEGFYYSSYDRPDGSVLSALTDTHKLYFHRVGSAQADDELVFGGAEEERHRYVSAQVTEDDRYVLISAANTTTGNKLFLIDLAEPAGTLITVVADEESDTRLVDNRAGDLFLYTNRDAPNGRVVVVNAQEPTPVRWRDFIPEREQVLSVSTGAGYFFANYMVDALSRVEQINDRGRKVRDIILPDLGTASGFGGKREQKTLYFNFTNYRIPSSIYALDAGNGEVDLYRESNSSFASDSYESRQVFYESKDGTRVPMIITHRSDLVRDGTAPTLLYAYGGFNASIRPRFSSTVATWLELGGVYAVPNIRGGGEYGKAWHDAGTQQQKQNVFDDFIAAAEFLFDERYTSPSKLAIRGGSNGGLLIGAVMTQRPDIAQVALPAVGVMDMLRYHKFTSGAGWSYDYGTADDNEAMFRYLLAYSPLHNLRVGERYPATLVTTADHDDRVVPAHSFKFAAELQRSQGGIAPTLIRIETDAGHGSGMPIGKLIELYADVYGFTLYNMGYERLAE